MNPNEDHVVALGYFESRSAKKGKIIIRPSAPIDIIIAKLSAINSVIKNKRTGYVPCPVKPEEISKGLRVHELSSIITRLINRADNILLFGPWTYDFLEKLAKGPIPKRVLFLDGVLEHARINKQDGWEGYLQKLNLLYLDQLLASIDGRAEIQWMIYQKIIQNLK